MQNTDANKSLDRATILSLLKQYFRAFSKFSIAAVLFASIQHVVLSTAMASTKDAPAIIIETDSSDQGYGVFASMPISIEKPLDIDDFLNLMHDIEGSCDWIANCRHTAVLKRIDEKSYLVRTELDVAWPFKDRDMVIQIDIEQSDTSITVKLSDRASDFPAQKGFVRITEIEGEWTLLLTQHTYENICNTDIGITDENLGSDIDSAASRCIDTQHHEQKNKHNLQYTGKANPNGLIPSWFALEYLKVSTKTTMQNLDLQWKAREENREKKTITASAVSSQ